MMTRRPEIFAFWAILTLGSFLIIKAATILGPLFSRKSYVIILAKLGYSFGDFFQKIISSPW
jgi:hypothetical protein